MDLFDKEIDLDKEASDILILEGAYLKNLATGKTGTLGEVVRGRKFIMLDSNPEQVTVSGYYATYDEYQDEILIITAEKKPGQGWRETARCVFYWQDQFLRMKHTGMDVVSTTGMFDICGQALTYEEGGKRYIRLGSAENSGFIEACVSFFEGGLYMTDWCSLHQQFFVDNIDKVITLIGRMRGNYHFGRPCIVYGDTFLMNDENEAASIPEQAKKRMEKYVIESMQKYAEYAINLRIWKGNNWLCVIQNDNGVVWVRAFRLMASVRYPVSESRVYVIEKSRCLLAKHLLVEMPCDHIIYADDLKGTFLEHSLKDLDEWLKMVKDWDENGCMEAEWEDGNASLARLEARFYAKHGFGVEDLIPAANVFASVSIMEKLVKSEFPWCKNFREYLYNGITSGTFTNREVLTATFGEMNDSGPIDRMMNLPSGLFEYISEMYGFSFVYLFKAAFAKDKNYLLRLDIESAKKAFDLFAKKASTNASSSRLSEILAMMSEMFGMGGMMHYVSYLSGLLDGKDNLGKDRALRSYEEYLNMLLVIGPAAEGCEWNIKKESLDKKKSSLRMAYCLTADSVKKEAAKCILKNREEELRAYGYEDGTFLITYPKDPEDVVKEGVKLNHCAKAYAEDVVYGRRLILFIRRVQAPDKPFFTLELKCGQIRQCHGHNNLNIDTEPGLEDFLRAFCKEKNLVFTDGSGLY